MGFPLLHGQGKGEKMQNTNEYRKDDMLFIREIKKCECIRKNGNEYWVDCRIHQRGDHTYHYSCDNDYISKFRGGKKFYLEEKALNAVREAVREFEEKITRFRQAAPQRIEIKELNTTVYYCHLLAWNNYRTYVFLTEFHLKNGDVVTEGVEEGALGKMILSVPSRMDIKENDENLTEEEIKERQNKRKKKIEKYKIRQKRLKEEKKLKIQKNKELEEKQKQLKVITNIDGINNMMDIKVKFEKLSFKYMDDSGIYLIPLLSIDVHDILVSFIQNSNPDSIENISNLILESVARKEIPLKDYDIIGLYMYVAISFDTSINFYNDRVNNWEPIIERYSGELKVDQATSFSRMRVFFNSDDMFNMNVSVSSMNVLNRVLKKFSEPVEKWNKELNNEDDVGKDVNTRTAIEFLNLSGIDIECWIDAQEEKYRKDKNKVSNGFKLKASGKESKREIMNNELEMYYQQLSEAQIKISKDKFSFRIKGYVPIYGNDFSTNYTTSFRMKKSKIAKDELSSIYSRIRKNPNKTEASKDAISTKSNKDNDNVIRTNSFIIERELLDDDSKSLITETNEDNYTDSIKSSKNEGLKEKLLEQEEPHKPNLVEDEIEILVKVRQSGNMKSVIFESNVFIFNNLQLPINLSFVSPDDYINKYGGKDSNINHLENNNTFLLNTCKKYSVPINYIVNKYRVYVSFYNKLNDKENNFVLLYENFSLLKQNLPEFIKYGEEYSAGLVGDEKKIILEDKYSKIVEIKQNNNQFYISCNLLLQKGGNDSIKEMPNIREKNDKLINFDQNDQSLRNRNLGLLLDSFKHDFYSKTFSYLFILDESLLIENKIPFNIKCKLLGGNEKEMTIRPLQQKEFLDIDQSKTSLQFSFNYVSNCTPRGKCFCPRKYFKIL